MRAKIYFTVCVVVAVASEVLLITSFDLGYSGILLLAAFGGGLVGAAAFGGLAFRKKD